MKTFTLEQVGERAWAAIAEPGGVAIGNAGFVALDEEVVVFDTTISITAGRALREEAERHGMIATIVYSHWHPDHVYGANAMPGASYVVATERTKQLMETRGSERLAQLKADPPGQGAFAQLPDEVQRLQLIYPDETFADERAFGDALALTYGGGHTLSDAVLWLAEERILFAADLIVNRTHPWVGDGDVDAWPGILERLAELGATTIVPGHGPVAGPGTIDFMTGYLDALRQARPGDPVPAEYVELGHADIWARNVAAVSS